MVVYWDLVAVVNGAVDYLLLLAAARLAGRELPRFRLLCAAAFGATYAVVQLFLPCPSWMLPIAFAAMAALAFSGTGRALKLSLLTALIACALGGIMFLLGEMSGSLVRVARGMVYAQLPWGVLFGATGMSYLLLCFIFRGGARHDGGDLVRATISYGGKDVTLTLLRDTGNLLCDAETGLGMPVIGESALRPLLSGISAPDKVFSLQGYQAVGQPAGTLKTFLCDALTVDGVALGARRIAIAPELYGDEGFQGLWCAQQEGVR